MKNEDNILMVSPKLVAAWEPAFEAYLGKDVMAGVTPSRKKIMTAMASNQYAKLTGNEIGMEADMALMTADNSQLAMNVLNPVAGPHNGLVSQAGTKGSADRQFLVGICVAIAAKTIGLDLVQTVPATSANITIKYLNVVYNGGDLNNAANNTINVVTIGFKNATNVLTNPVLATGTKYVIGHPTPSDADDAKAYEFIELNYVKPDRKGVGYAIFTVGRAFTATNNAGTLSDVTYINPGPAIGAIASDGAVYSINAAMDSITQVTDGNNALSINSIENTKAVENYVPNQTTKGLRRTLTRSEADAGTDHKVELDINSDAHVIGNRTFIGNVSRLQYKRLQEDGIDAIPYLTAAMKNEVSQEINWQIVSGCRAYGLTNALEYQANGMNFNTYIAPQAVNNIAFSALPYANELFDKDMQPVADKFAAVPNLLKTMQFETIASIGTYLCMLITQAAYAIGTDSRFGEADACIVSSSLAGYLAASSNFTKLSDKDVDMTASTGAKLSGYINGIKVYVDVNIPMNAPYVTVLRTNQDVKVDVPGISGDNVLVPGLAYLVKDLISTVQLVPSGTGGNKLILDSETDLIAVGETAYKAYLTFCFCVELAGLAS
jgi:hypothetical protein